MQSGLKPCVLDSRPSREAIFSLTELSVSWEKTTSATSQLRLNTMNRTLRHCKAWFYTAELFYHSRAEIIFLKLSVCLYLVVVLQQDPDYTLHALRLHRFACELQQVLQSISGVGGLTEVDVQSRRFTGFGQTQLLGRSFFMGNLSAWKSLD